MLPSGPEVKWNVYSFVIFISAEPEDSSTNFLVRPELLANNILRRVVLGTRMGFLGIIATQWLFTIYMEKPVGRWFVQMESKIPILEISVWGGVYHLNNRPNLPKEPRATLTSSKWRLKSLYSTRL